VKITLRQTFRIFSLYAVSIVLVVIFSLQTVGRVSIPLLQQIESSVYDFRLKVTLPFAFDPKIVIVDLDERSMIREGHWPWPRNKLAYLVDVLFDYYHIKLLGFDIVFSEIDDSSGLPVLEYLSTGPLRQDKLFKNELDHIKYSLEYDQLFANSLKNRAVVLGFGTRQQDQVSNIGALPKSLFTTDQLPINPKDLVPASGYTGNLKVLQEAALSGGFFSNPVLDDDGIIRRFPLLIHHQNEVYEALSLAMFRAWLGVTARDSLRPNFRAEAALTLANQESTSQGRTKEQAPPIRIPPLELLFETSYGTRSEDRKLEALGIEGFRIPVYEDGSVLIPYKGPKGSFPYVSATDVLNATAPIETLRDKTVLLGTTAVGLMDMRSTPVQNVFPGVEINANLLSGMLDQSFKERPTYTSTIEFLQIILIGALLIFFLPRLSASLATLSIIGCIAFFVLENIYAWQALGVSMRLAAPLVLLFLLYANQMFFGFFFESQAKKRLAGLFGQYVPTELVEEMSHQDSDFGIGGETREMTVLFSDVRGFTTISEGLSPDQLSRLMNELLTPLTRVIHQHKGTIDKYIGDAIMAFWGAPLEDPQHGLHAIQAALDMINTVENIRADFKARQWPEIKLGIGLNTGFMNVGNMGSEFRMAYTVLGDAVNLGSRLEGLTKHYGVSIIVSETTRQSADEYIFQELDRVRVKGKNKPVTIFEPLGHRSEVSALRLAELGIYERALALYHQQQWQEAEQLLKLTSEQYSQRVIYSLYLERIAHFKEHPPGDDWDGAFTHTSK
jgi:adenylate cyclase